MSSDSGSGFRYNAPARVLIVDDDQDLLNLIIFVFHNAGYETVSATNGPEALRALERERFSLLVLDFNIPLPNGLQICAEVRRSSNVPILMLSARDQEQDLLHALDAGADAYLIKPFGPRSLISRAHALLRRGSPHESLDTASSRFKLDIGELLLRHPGGEIPLTKLEARLLRLLMLNAGKLVATRDLVSEIWSAYNAVNRNLLKHVIFRLRRKLGSAPEVYRSLKTLPGGYLWAESTTENVDADHHADH